MQQRDIDLTEITTGKKDIYLTDIEMERFKSVLSAAIDVYSRSAPREKQIAQWILDGWGRITFIVSHNGKRIGMELTGRLEREEREL